MSKSLVRAEVRVNTYALMVDAVEVGLLMGWNRAHKHTDTPDPDQIREEQARAILNELSERFLFDGD